MDKLEKISRLNHGDIACARWTHGHFYWNELMTRDVERAKKFYADAIGWTFEAMPMPDGTYWVAKMGDEPVGGLFPTRPARNSTACRKAGCPISRSTTSMRG